MEKEHVLHLRALEEKWDKRDEHRARPWREVEYRHKHPPSLLLFENYSQCHRSLQQDLAALGRQDLQSHVVDNQQIGLEVALEQPRLGCLGLGLSWVSAQGQRPSVKAP